MLLNGLKHGLNSSEDIETDHFGPFVRPIMFQMWPKEAKNWPNNQWKRSVSEKKTITIRETFYVILSLEFRHVHESFNPITNICCLILHVFQGLSVFSFQNWLKKQMLSKCHYCRNFHLERIKCKISMVYFLKNI